MKVILLVPRAGINFVQEIGQTIEVGPDEAGRMFAAGQCKHLSDADEAEARAAAGLDQPVVAGVDRAPVDDDDDDSDAINDPGSEAAPEPKPPQTAIEKAKARRATTKKD